MAIQLDPNELVTFKELPLSKSIQIATAIQVMIVKGLITERMFYSKLKDVQTQYQAKRRE